MPWSTWTRLVQEKMTIFFLPTANAWQFLTSFKACDWCDTFSALAPVLAPEQKYWRCHHLSPFMAVSTIPKIWHSRHSWLTKLGFCAWTSSYTSSVMRMAFNVVHSPYCIIIICCLCRTFVTTESQSLYLYDEESARALGMLDVDG